MTSMKKITYAALLGLFFVSCTDTNTNKLESLDKKTAREVTLTTEIVGDSVYHLVKQRIWANNELILAKIDTLKTANTIENPKVPGESVKLEKVPIYVTVE